MCKMHYKRWLTKGDAGPAGYVRQPGGGRICDVDGCQRFATARHLCPMHYKRWEASGTTGEAASKKPGFTTRTVGGTRRVNRTGYVMVKRPLHPNADQRGWVFEHRVVMEECIGRLLGRYETVHHVNGDRADNRPENLELWSSSQPPGQRVQDKVRWAYEIIALYDSDRYSLPFHSAQPL